MISKSKSAFSGVRHTILGLGIAFGAVLSAVPAFAVDPAIVAAAKKEGSVTWYTTQQIDSVVQPLSTAFEAKYGIKVNFVRAATAEVALRVYNEGKAGKMTADVFDGSSAGENLKRENLVLKWLPDTVKEELGKDYADPDGYWVANTLYVLAPTFNTDLVKKGEEPKTFEDLLKPRWKGKMAWNSGASAGGAPGFIGLVLKSMGEEKGMAYLRELAKQNIAGPKVVSAQLVDQVIAGEYDVALQTFNTQPARAATTGAPVNWVQMQPAMVTFSVMSVTKGAPHENAGKLLVEFATSEEGQKIFNAGGLIPVHPKVAPTDPKLRPDGVAYKGEFFTPSEIDGQMAKWLKIYEDLFRFK
jgi:iron(III) transport system substrate-binding protein